MVNPALRAFLLGTCLASLTACAAPPPTAHPSPTSVEQPAPTPTDVPFPTLIPTATWTPEASTTPTRDPQLGLGALLFSDTFELSAPWDLSSSASGSAAILNGRLTLAIRAPREYHWSLRTEPLAADFLARVEIRTEVCSPGDEFGLIARANAMGEQYRFLIGCDGTARISRVLETGSRALTLRVESPAILAGAPAVNQLTVRARGLDLALLVNGEEVATVRDAALVSGRFGLLARAGPEGQVSVKFDDLTVNLLSGSGAATPSATP